MDDEEINRLHNKLLYETIAIDYLSPRVRDGRDFQRLNARCRNYLTAPDDIENNNCRNLLDILVEQGHITVGCYDVLKDLVSFSAPLIQEIEDVERAIKMQRRRLGFNRREPNIREKAIRIEEMIMRIDFCDIVPIESAQYDNAIRQISRINRSLFKVADEIIRDPDLFREYTDACNCLTESLDESSKLFRLFYYLEGGDNTVEEKNDDVHVLYQRDRNEDIWDTRKVDACQDFWKNYNRLLKTRIALLMGITEKGASIRKVHFGSIYLFLSFESIDNMEKLISEYQTGVLQKEVQENLVTEDFLKCFALITAKVELSIDREDLFGYSAQQIHGQTQSGEDINMQRGDIPTDETKEQLQQPRVMSDQQLHGQTQSGKDIDMHRGDIRTDEAKQQLQQPMVMSGQEEHGQTQSGEDIDMQRGDIQTDETKLQLEPPKVISGFASSSKMLSYAYAPTQETTNLNRVSHVLRCPCTDQLRALLRHHVPPASFQRVIQEKRTNLPRVTAPQRELILPSTGHYTGDYSDMDVSLLYLLLRNICNIQPHRNGWGHSPDDTDFSLSACIDRIREIRNKIGHSTSSGLPQIDFIDQWSDIKRSVKSIDKHLNNDNKYEKDVDCLLEASMDPEREAIYLDQLKSKVKTEGIEDFRSLVASINELEADRIQILSFRMDDAIDLDRIYASVSIIDEYDKRGSTRSEDSNFQCIAPDKIFSTQSENIARFIFMLGEAGYGKTVQCQRFAKSWCQAWHNDIVRERDTRPQIADLNRCLKQFDFLFFIKMRDVSIQSENLIDLIQDVYSRYRLTKQNLADIRMILENGKFKSLVLLDGLDEWNISDDKKKFLLDKCIPNCRHMPKSTILISMRSWKFMEVEEVCNPNIDRVIRLNGLDEDGVKELTTNLLSNYFQNKTTFDDFNERKAYVENAVSYAPTEIKSLMNIPMLTVFYILTLYEDVNTGNSLTTFYLSIIEALFKRMSRKAQAEGIRGEFSNSTFVRTLLEYMWNQFRQLLPRWLLPGSSRITECISLQEYPKVAQHLNELTRLGKVAFESLSSEESILVFSEDKLNQQLDKEIVDLFLRVGLVIKSETTGRFHEDKIRISFLHKTIHEFLASLYLIYGRKETYIDGIMKDVLLVNVNKAIEYTPVLIFLGGLSPAVGCRISSLIRNLTNDDDDIKKYRFNFHTRIYQKIFHLYNLQLRCYKEVRRSKSIEAFEGDGQTLKFSFSDVILLSTDTDVPTIRESANVLKFHPNDIISLNMVCIPNNKEEGISNAEIKTFLDESQSITSIYIDGYVDGKCRLIDEYSPKMFHLITLGLSNVSFRDNILANLITKKESKEEIRALGILYLKSAEDDVIDFEYRIPSIHWRNTTKSGFRRYAHPKKTGTNSDPQRKQRTPFLRIFLESLPDYRQLSILHITYMEAEEDRQKLLQVLPKLNQLHDIAYSGSNRYPYPDYGYDATVISNITNLEKLQEVDLRSISLKESVLNFENLSKLKEISLDAFKIHTANGWEMLFESFSKIETLQKIFLYDTNVAIEVLDEYKNIRGSVCIEKMDRQTYEIL